MSARLYKPYRKITLKKLDKSEIDDGFDLFILSGAHADGVSRLSFHAPFERTISLDS
jgi:hypothetical protein